MKKISLKNILTKTFKNKKKANKKIKTSLKKKNLSKLLKDTDYIFHLAGLSKVRESINNPRKYYKANVISTLNILNSIHMSHHQKLLLNFLLHIL